MPTEKNPLQVVTGPVRLSYVHVFEPHSNQADQDPKYSLTMLIPKSDTKTIADIKAAQKLALENGKAKTFGGSIPKNWKNTLHDGDEEADLEKNPEYEGHYYMAVNSKNQPGLVDRKLNPVMDKAEIYSGCWARVQIGAFAFNNQGGKGVSFGLNHVMKWADDEMFGGRMRAEDAFGDIADDEDDELI